MGAYSSSRLHTEGSPSSLPGRRYSMAAMASSRVIIHCSSSEPQTTSNQFFMRSAASPGVSPSTCSSVRICVPLMGTSPNRVAVWAENSGLTRPSWPTVKMACCMLSSSSLTALLARARSLVRSLITSSRWSRTAANRSWRTPAKEANRPRKKGALSMIQSRGVLCWSQTMDAKLKGRLSV